MPANKKYISSSLWIKFGKLSAAILGGLLASISFHMALAIWTDRSVIIPTAVYSGFVIWVAFMIVTYWVPKVWQAWTLLGAITLVCTIAISLGQ
ncbi:hypothetical protein [Chondrinema litorale]|uniref:hypothetical protein n=1 Tax=Chondrinema litorale TaxID=2994555 RepID=UPI002543223B|nr:hypothetical protein [Chondrinema litorale]UZR99654.1 hypothetical protein OQ292_37330 [Chondrinema litorale]